MISIRNILYIDKDVGKVYNINVTNLHAFIMSPCLGFYNARVNKKVANCYVMVMVIFKRF